MAVRETLMRTILWLQSWILSKHTRHYGELLQIMIGFFLLSYWANVQHVKRQWDVFMQPSPRGNAWNCITLLPIMLTNLESNSMVKGRYILLVQQEGWPICTITLGQIFMNPISKPSMILGIIHLFSCAHVLASKQSTIKLSPAQSVLT